MSSKKVFIVLSHPEPDSFSHAMANATKQTLEEAGHEVKISDLHAMGFDPINDRRNFLAPANPDRFNQQSEERAAAPAMAFNESLKAEMDKLAWCDIVVFQFPIHWFSVPAMLKGWIDKVLASGWAYGGGKWFETGAFVGKKGILQLTTGGPEHFYKHDAIMGDMEDILYPLNHGVFWFCGLTPLKPFVTYGASHNADHRVAEMARLRTFWTNIDDAPVIRYPATNEVRMGPITSETLIIPSRATAMIATTNGMMQAWVDNDGAAYRRYCAPDIKMTIPAYGLDISGVDSIWGVRTSMGTTGSLNPHTVDTHSFPAPHTVKCMTHVISKETGERVQLSECVFVFDDTDLFVIHYHQENLFMKT